MKPRAAHPHPSPKTHGFTSEIFLRALAISAVVLIHTLSSLKPSPFIDTSSWQSVAVAIDQFCRISVPLFVVLSGFGLTEKYKKSPFKWGEFLQRRVFKLLPWYIVWSAIFAVVFWLIPAWHSPEPSKPFIWQLILGQADYQLYFVPMIFQLYLLFPLIWWLVKKNPWLALALVGIFQVGWYYYLAQVLEDTSVKTYFVSDQHQYFWSLTWLWYFVLGIVLSLTNFQSKTKKMGLLWGGLAIVFWLWLSQQAVHNIQTGTDPLFALRFTRISILVFGSLGSIALLSLTASLKKIPGFMAWLGKNSYSIYLSHTLVLRIVFEILTRLGLQ